MTVAGGSGWEPDERSDEVGDSRYESEFDLYAVVELDGDDGPPARAVGSFNDLARAEAWAEEFLSEPYAVVPFEMPTTEVDTAITRGIPAVEARTAALAAGTTHAGDHMGDA
jgi:hypothetical protein